MHAKEAAETILSPYMSLLAEPFLAAWDSWKTFGEEQPEKRRHLGKTSRACMVHDWATARARTIFADMGPEVVIYESPESPGFLLIGFDSALMMRLKKYRDGTFATSGIPTGQQQSFANQEPLVGFPKATNVVLGYRLDVLQTEIASIAITCSTGGRLHWSLDVPIENEAVVVEAPPSPQAPPPPSIRSTEDREEREETGS
jgi:hypothetical protein